ncbi:restriction endonuclease subunit S [Escherichia fergusonii]|uniref:restriction endonuclease subunit S n=1 Tax=Escherichia fergusonii TaxID=564 RepID=UPI0015E9F71E|nr:restriction endonuclease subunit S [Escherichia fergusonii]EFH7280415.1 restriction endonuclease subunit S [Escherichia coli]QMC79571.1 restriction endonuclease subunit S [Escherichia fergusonii]HCO7574037.1 restriction endonuclease subunit S [Escherichia fergusonii]
MSELSYLEKLLDGVEVEWKTLGTVIKTVTASSKLKSQAYRASGKLPIVDQGIKFIAGYTDEDVTPIEAGKYIIFGDHSEHIKYVDFPFVQGADGLKILSPISANAKYIYHAFLKFYKKELSYKRHWSTAQQTLIPIPCPDNPEKSLAIQSEIVRILDKFTALTAELTAELNMRKKQYNYYRDQLLSFKEGEVNWTTLGNEELFHICAGGTPSKSKAEYWDNGSIPWLKSESCNNKPVYFSKDFISELGLKKSTAKLLPKNTTLIALVGATIFKTAFLEFEATTNQNIASIKSTKENIIADKFIFYFLTNLYNTLKSEMRNYGMLNLTNLRQFRIPIPCIAEQKRIVSILDKFDALTNSITEGLPREIELRQKQYEYYRDLLFSFPKPETVSN